MAENKNVEELEHIRMPVLDELIRIAKTSFSAEELRYLSYGFSHQADVKEREE